VVDLQNSFTVVKSSKFPTKAILGYPPHLKYVGALPWKTEGVVDNLISVLLKIYCSLQQWKNLANRSRI